MKCDVTWSYPALFDLRSIHWLRGAEVDAAIMRFATTGAGNIEKVPEQPTLRILRVGHHRVLHRADFQARTIFVIRIFR